MARQPSKILTPAEKKAQSSELKALLKTLKDEHKKLVSFGKEKEKLHTATMKQHAKDLAAKAKELQKVEDQLAALA